MKGIKIQHQGEVFNIAVDFPITVFMYQRDGYYFLDLSGTDENNTSYTWIDKKMKTGDFLDFELIDQDKSLTSEPVKICKAFEENTPLEGEELAQMFREFLARFNVLEEFLKKEGLIQ
ncbi:hypothetical protein HMPREF0765_0881 [Sphingobacterium spiritivorum ATCC 33300]|uniref:Uncharacterized protein n=1 Tax=Sphingobacterium spiritivorum ATCC 33300 TaxID=525372 RepID=C2FU75_SPHSI|nr:hypothetical protein [Sphingobacterium spiritivorum]EEI93453.1 hypothetical protein HMPREF0765_0881 [Sphingobacterium spiritivorum ATCC 33300]QQS95800.1 hypothetical protein I6J03_20900 [Sphingobacterium spiritivorum]